MQLVDVIQGSPEWHAARAGVPTASEFKRFVNERGELRRPRAKSSNQPLSDGGMTYIAELIAESIGWQKSEFLGSPDIERGHQLEDRARKFLAFEIDDDIEEVGFCLSDDERYGASPDGMTSEGVPVELKCPDYHTQVKYLMAQNGTPAVPFEYVAQVHGHMLVTGADACYFCAFTMHPKLAPILLKVERNEITERLAESVAEFCDVLDEVRKGVLAE